MKKFIPLAGLLASFFPSHVSAHEVYVLSDQAIATAVATPRFEMLPVLFQNLGAFFLWAAITATTILVVFIISIAPRLERRFAPFFAKIKPYASTIGRVSIGLSFIASGYFQALYGPELPLAQIFGTYANFLSLLFIVIGITIALGYFLRSSAFIGLLFFAVGTYFYGWYMLTYLTYLGEVVLLILLGTHKKSAESSFKLFSVRIRRLFAKITDTLAPYGFFFLRITFGISLIYSSVYAKIIHNNLALEVAASPLANHFYGVAHYLGFEPHFLVLGAAIIEMVLGIFFLLGIEIRFFALFIEFWLMLSLFYFGETVWPHIMLIGIPIMFFCYGYDKYSLEGRYFKKGKLQPVL